MPGGQEVLSNPALTLCSSEVQQPQRPSTIPSAFSTAVDLRQRTSAAYLPLDGKEEIISRLPGYGKASRSPYCLEVSPLSGRDRPRGARLQDKGRRVLLRLNRQADSVRRQDA